MVEDNWNGEGVFLFTKVNVLGNLKRIDIPRQEIKVRLYKDLFNTSDVF